MKTGCSNPITRLARRAVLLALCLCLMCAGALAQYDERAVGEYFGQWGFVLAFYNQKCAFSVSPGVSVSVVTDGWEDVDNSDVISFAEHLMLDFPPSPYALHYDAYYDTLSFSVSLDYIREEPWLIKLESPGYSMRALAKASGDTCRFDFPAQDALAMIDEMIAGQSVMMYIETDSGTSEVAIGSQSTAKLYRALQVIGSGVHYCNPDDPQYMNAALLPDPTQISAKPRITIPPASSGSGSMEDGAYLPPSGYLPSAAPIIRATPTPTPKPTATPKPTPTPSPTPDPWGNVPLSYRRVYSKGDSGEGVQYIKRRMRYLGYYRRGANIDGRFNDLMAERLQQFQRNNGLQPTGEADQATLVALFKGADAVVTGEFYEKVEPEITTDGRITLFIQKGGSTYAKASDDQLKFRLKVKNEGKSKTVTAFELYIYSTDIWGRRLQPDNRYFVYTTEKTIKPGATAFSDYFLIPDRSDIEELHVAIGKVRYQDGSIEEVYSPDYWTFTFD